MEYWESQEMAMLEECAREKSEDETKSEAMMREKAEGIEISRAESKSK